MGLDKWGTGLSGKGLSGARAPGAGYARGSGVGTMLQPIQYSGTTPLQGCRLASLKSARRWRRCTSPSLQARRMLHFARCTLHVAFCALHFAFCVFHAACCMLRVAFCVLHSACCTLRVARCVLYFAWACNIGCTAWRRCNSAVQAWTRSPTTSCAQRSADAVAEYS